MNGGREVFLEETKLSQVVESALLNVQGNRRWQNAIRRGAVELLTNPYMHYTGKSLLMLTDSGEIYEANGTCQCVAFKSQTPCRHRAAYKLLKNYLTGTAARG
ncbi:MAG: hypothetical protein QOC99_2194 [Acidobacteriota bacterium]|jgi:hypothetical protein|nr:hypothetical protein [Acidobacteriota bacterium]